MLLQSWTSFGFAIEGKRTRRSGDCQTLHVHKPVVGRVGIKLLAKSACTFELIGLRAILPLDPKAWSMAFPHLRTCERSPPVMSGLTSFSFSATRTTELGTTPQEGMIEKMQVHRRRMHTPVLRFVSANHKEQF